MGEGLLEVREHKRRGGAGVSEDLKSEKWATRCNCRGPEAAGSRGANPSTVGHPTGRAWKERRARRLRSVTGS